MIKKKWLTLTVSMALQAALANSVLAAELDSYALDDTVVTATRTKKHDVDVPASTTVLTAEKIKESGAQNAAEALSKVNGFIYKSMGPMGASMGTMNNELNIRGVKNGTLVLMNGNPVSWRGKYNLEQIPAENIERIEVVKGSSSVLYGSEAMGGVVNIITKKGGTNEISLGGGNYGQQNISVNAGDENFGVHYGFKRWGHQDGVKETEVESPAFNGSTRVDVHDIETRNAGITYRISPRLSFLYDYSEGRVRYTRYVDRVDSTKQGVTVGELFNSRIYTTKQHITQLNYDDGAWKGSLYFNANLVESKGPTKISTTKKTPDGYYNTRERNTTYGADVQKHWKLGDRSSAILGADIQHEVYDSLCSYTTKEASRYMRNNWGVFGQWEQKFDAKNTGIFGLRETWTTGAAENYNNFSMSGQWLHKMNKNNNLYASVGQSFIMPTFSQMYGSGDRALPAKDLKPQKGINYEIGWKQTHNHHNWRAAIFHTEIDDNIAARWDKKNAVYQYTNEEFRNTGLEISADIQAAHGWSYQYGLTWQNPETKSAKVSNDWERTLGKIQLTGGVTYKKDKLVSSLQASYLADRVQSPSGERPYRCKPYLLTSWTASYAPDKASELTLVVNNILNRDDVAMHTGSHYYVAPTSFLLNYRYRF